ncbi:MAG TPA: ATP-binding protein, partial [Blastocatellia bacterium]|nr:ATP-binding protein [Blastocatellia bacterium]
MNERVFSKLRNGVAGLPEALESHGRDILLVGFFFLLLLVCFIGYRGQKSLQELEDQARYVQSSDSRRLRIVLSIQEAIGVMDPEVRMMLATPDQRLLHYSSRMKLEGWNREIRGSFADGDKSNLGSLPEFKKAEETYKEYWAAISLDDPSKAPWDEKRKALVGAVSDLAHLSQKETEQHNAELLEMSRKARGHIGLATAGVLIVGLIVTGLTFYQIHQIFNRLSKSYAESADSRDYLRSLLNGLVSGLVVVDVEGVISSANNVFLTQVNVTADDPVGCGYREVFATCQGLVEAITERFETDRGNHRYCGRYEMGQGRQFDAYASPLAIGGEHRGIILVFIDSTEVERAQTELRRNRALSAIGQMTAQVAHEIKNPLGSIGLALDLLKRKTPNKSADEAEVIGVIDRSVDHLRAIVTELLEFTRPKELRLTPVDLNRLIENLIPMVADRCRAKNVAIETALCPEIPLSGYDEPELRKLFLNLMINALDASEPDSAIQVRTDMDTSNMIRVEVADHGCGMDAETLRRLYEPFYTTKAKGTGLGMAISKKIIELHRGDIERLI